MTKKNLITLSTFLLVIGLSSPYFASSKPKLKNHVIHKVTHYYQNDPKWKDYLYGGYDPLEKYGCGPTAVSIVISSLTSNKITPPKMADWAYQNNYWAYRSGSFHSLIPNACKNFGLNVEKLYLLDENSIRDVLEMDKLIICLMGPGHFTERGHYIVIHGMYADGTLAISDPYSKSNTKKRWKVKTIIQELSSATDNGSPIWIISNPNKF